MQWYMRGSGLELLFLSFSSPCPLTAFDWGASVHRCDPLRGPEEARACVCVCVEGFAWYKEPVKEKA